MNLDAAQIVALFGGVAGLVTAVGVLAQQWVTRRNKETETDATIAVKRIDDGAAIRQELRADVANLKTEMGKVQTDLEAQRRDNFKMWQQTQELGEQLRDAQRTITQQQEQAGQNKTNSLVNTKRINMLEHKYAKLIVRFEEILTYARRVRALLATAALTDGDRELLEKEAVWPAWADQYAMGLEDGDVPGEITQDEKETSE